MTQQIVGLLPIFLVFIVFYMFIIRPQSKKAKEDKQMRSSLQIGNRIVTISGVFGTIAEIDDEKNVVSLNIAPNVNITVYKSSIASVLKEKTEETKK